MSSSTSVTSCDCGAVTEWSDGEFINLCHVIMEQREECWWLLWSRERNVGGSTSVTSLLSREINVGGSTSVMSLWSRERNVSSSTSVISLWKSDIVE